MRRAYLGLLLLGWGICAHAQAPWVWLDENQRKVFSDRPPPAHISKSRIVQRPSGDTAALTSEEVVPPPRVAVSAPSASSLIEAEKSASTQADRIKQQRAENCAIAKKNLALIQSGVRLQTVNAQGERSVLDDAARAGELARVQAAIDLDCR